ncbi:MAG: glutathione transferase GstA [Betaproteobacteria bacterium RIFCSPLOWO2_02_FULL_62_17]|nr:MAG: glutathione transferase GstA [Betaproteobacteria bacterium RIFCSPLOWO2_02_FULL_62_17]
MKLYYRPGACSISPHIALCEAGIPHQLDHVDLQAKKTESGADYLAINPKGYVPALQLDNGEVLVEGAAIVQYISDQKPESGLAPKAGTMERYRLMEWLTFISSELHKGFSPLFNAAMPDAAKKIFRDRLAQRWAYVDKQLAGKNYLMGSTFTVADGYLYNMARWAKRVDLDLSGCPNVTAFAARVEARPKVVEALKAEGLM